MQIADWSYPVSDGYPDEAWKIERHLRRLQRRYRERDIRWEEVRAVRCGEWEMFPDVLSDAFPSPIIANFIDTTARDLSELLAPLPAFNCSSASMRSDTDRKKADIRTKIATNYVTNSRMDVQMLYGADHYWTYGMCVMYVEPDFDEKMPRIVIEDPSGGYPEWDRWGRLRAYTRKFYADAHVLADLYPEYADTILKQAEQTAGTESEWQMEMIRYWDDWGQRIVLGGKHPFILDRCKNRTDRIPMVIAKRPWLDPYRIKGQFDDVVWVQLARNEMANLQFSAVEKAVQAPLAVPNDVQDLSVGPDAVWRSQTPDKIRRVGMEMTNMSFLENNTLLADLQAGSRYPAARSGEMDSSIVTGRGVNALMGGLDTQVRSAQSVFKTAFGDLISLCFELDEKTWGGTQKTIKGVADGSPYEVRYTPGKDIGGNRSCDVEYGIASGMDPARAIVMMLQLRAEKVFSRDFMQRHVPFGMDVSEEASKVNVEDTRDALLQGIYAYVQAIPAMAQQGMDPSDAVQKVSAIVKGLQRGRPVEDVVSAVFAPPELDEAQLEAAGLGAGAGPDGAGAGGAMSGGGPAGGLNPSGLMQGVPAGQAGQAPGGRPDLSVMLAGLTASGKPNMSSMTMRRRRF